MEKLVSERESVLLGYSPQSQRYLFVNHNVSGSSSSSSRKDADIDFRDVFGGPPRRSSVQEARYDEEDDDEEDEYDNKAGHDEKPVFGEGGGIIARRRHPNEDFFGDIFKGKELYSLSCSPTSKHSLSSAPGSRVLSPVRPLPPGADPQQLLIGGSDSPAQFSLPSRVTELPTFGSPTRNQHRNKDSGSNGSSNYSHSPLSRPSSQANNNRAREVLESNVRLRTYLSKEMSLGSDELMNLEKPEAKETAIKLERRSSASDSDAPQVQGKGGQFHFSIYKWATKGSPLDMPLRAGKGLGSKEKGKVPSSSSFNGWLNGEEMAKRSPRVSPDHQSSGRVDSVEQVNDVEGANLPLRKSESSRSYQVAVMKHKKVETEAVQSLAKMESSKGKVESSFVVIKEAPKTEFKPVPSLFYVNEHEPGNDTVAANGGSKESKVKSTKNPAAIFYVGEDVKKGPGKSVNVDNGDVENVNVGGSERSSRSSIGKNKGGGGKVKEFVKIFNQERPGKPEVNVETQRQNSWRKEIGKPMTPDATSAKSTGIGKELTSQSKDKLVDASILVDENPRRSQKQETDTTRPYNTNSVSTPATTLAASGTSLLGSAPDVSESIIEELDDCFHDNFLMKDLLQDDHRLPEETRAKSEAEEIKAIDDKIRSWSRGKEGNIRSLLSTLQYVLWPGSGWKTVPLVDIVEGNAVRRPYQKALLCLHPDKLQQKGATAHQKYMAEKVFDILQEAWTQFNSLGSV